MANRNKKVTEMVEEAKEAGNRINTTHLRRTFHTEYPQDEGDLLVRPRSTLRLVIYVILTLAVVYVLLTAALVLIPNAITSR